VNGGERDFSISLERYRERCYFGVSQQKRGRKTAEEKGQKRINGCKKNKGQENIEPKLRKSKESIGSK
jgi:hypothetical protein